VIASPTTPSSAWPAYFYSRDIGRVWRVAEALEYGMVGINTGLISTEVAPFGGVKQSGLGREGSRHGIEDYLEMKYLCARAAFEDRRWAGMAPARRKRVLIRFSELLLEHRDELALTETLDMGKPIAASRATDVNAAANTLRWYGEAIDKVYDEIAPTADTSLALITREPVGVVGAIVPWNYPMLMASWKIAPALATGNSVVLKPSEKSPLTALRMGELALEAGLPEGVLNVVPGYGHEAGQALALHMDVDCIAFTGSTRIGKQIMQYAGQSNLKRAWTELGGKSPLIVCADVGDLDRAVSAAIGSIFYNQGESCNAPSRLFVRAHRSRARSSRACAGQGAGLRAGRSARSANGDGRAGRRHATADGDALHRCRRVGRRQAACRRRACARR
jgi:acyl-CoA reductase-like NAD-dependent aldehyde dehydrogenase